MIDLHGEDIITTNPWIEAKEAVPPDELSTYEVLYCGTREMEERIAEGKTIFVIFGIAKYLGLGRKDGKQKWCSSYSGGLWSYPQLVTVTHWRPIESMPVGYNFIG